MSRCSLGLYEKAMPDNLSFKEKLLSAGSAGFDYVEISIDESDTRLSRLDWSREERKELLSLSREVGTYLSTMCLSGHRKYPLGSFIPDTEKCSLAIMESAIELAYDLGIRIIQLAGYDVYYNETSNEKTREKFIENISKSAEMAASRGIILGFETMENDFMNTVSKAVTFVNTVSSPYLKIYPDIGNITNGTKNVIADLKSGKGHIAAAHLKETKPGVFRNLMFGEGQVDFASAIKELRAQGVMMYTAEFWYQSGDYMENLKKAHDFLRPFLT